VSFIASALFIGSIDTPEAPPKPATERAGMLTEIREGGRVLLGDPVLRAIAASGVVMDFSVRVIGAVYLLYVTRDLGFEPGVLGVVFAVGGVASFLGAFLAGRAARSFGVGPSLVMSLILVGGAWLLTPVATDASLIALGLIVGHQFGDTFWTMYDINSVSLRQSITEDRYMGRVNAGVRFSGLAASLVGALAGGVLGELVGLRLTLVLGSCGLFVAAGLLLASPVWSWKDVPLTPEPAPGEIAAG
jgi:MFS family permease